MLPVHIAAIGMSQFGKSAQSLVEIMAGAAALQAEEEEVSHA